MFISQADRIVGSFSSVAQHQLDKPLRFSLDMTGVAGLLGGDDAVSAMTAVHVYGNRRCLGWYNNPGSFQIAKWLRSLPIISSRSSRNVQMDSTKLLDLDRCKGPKFRAAHSGTVIEETGYLASLFMNECTAQNSEGRVIPGRRTQPVGITIADLGQAPAFEVHPTSSGALTLLFATAPIAVSITACALSALCGDWYGSSLILLGIVASGVSCHLLGSADFVFTHPEPAKGSPAGDGILTTDKDIVLLKGTEGAVNSITRGNFTIRFSSHAHLNLIRWCSILFFIQCFAQLLLIPQASLFGQIMFLTSLGVSALYNAWVSSLDKERMHGKMLFERVLEKPTLTKYTLGTRTTAVVFMLLVLQLRDASKLLDELLPNDTKVWKHWKATILEQLRHPREHTFLETKVGQLDEFTQQEQDLLSLLYEDARAAYTGYMDYLGFDSL